MGRVTFITYRNRQILHIDFSNLKMEEVLDVIDEAKSIIAKAPANSLLTLSDFTDLSFNRNTSNKLKEYAEHNKPFVKAGALLGITGLKKVIHNI